MRKGINYIRISLSLDEESLAALKRLAELTGRSQSSLIRELLADFEAELTTTNGRNA